MRRAVSTHHPGLFLSEARGWDVVRFSIWHGGIGRVMVNKVKEISHGCCQCSPRARRGYGSQDAYPDLPAARRASFIHVIVQRITTVTSKLMVLLYRETVSNAGESHPQPAHRAKSGAGESASRFMSFLSLTRCPSCCRPSGCRCFREMKRGTGILHQTLHPRWRAQLSALSEAME